FPVVVLVLEEEDDERAPALGVVEDADLGRGQPLRPLSAFHLLRHLRELRLVDPVERHCACECHVRPPCRSAESTTVGRGCQPPRRALRTRSRSHAWSGGTRRCGRGSVTRGSVAAVAAPKTRATACSVSRTSRSGRKSQPTRAATTHNARAAAPRPRRCTW